MTSDKDITKIKKGDVFIEHGEGNIWNFATTF